MWLPTNHIVTTLHGYSTQFCHYLFPDNCIILHKFLLHLKGFEFWLATQNVYICCMLLLSAYLIGYYYKRLLWLCHFIGVQLLRCNLRLIALLLLGLMYDKLNHYVIGEETLSIKVCLWKKFKIDICENCPLKSCKHYIMDSDTANG